MNESPFVELDSFTFGKRRRNLSLSPKFFGRQVQMSDVITPGLDPVADQRTAPDAEIRVEPPGPLAVAHHSPAPLAEPISGRLIGRVLPPPLSLALTRARVTDLAQRMRTFDRLVAVDAVRRDRAFLEDVFLVRHTYTIGRDPQVLRFPTDGIGVAYTMTEIAEAGERSRRLDEFPAQFAVTDPGALIPIAESLNAALNAPQALDALGVESRARTSA